MRSEMDDDDDKVLYPKIGKTEITIDKVLSNLLNNDVTKNKCLTCITGVPNLQKHLHART